MKLSALYDGAPDVEVTGLALDSRKVQPGNMFFCLKGLEADGHAFAGKAADAGASVIVHSDPVEQRNNVHYVQVDDCLAESNRVCNLFFGAPSHNLTMFGVTGTNGKSTTSSIISDIFSKEKPCGYMGTISVRYGDFSRVPSLTTPDQVEIHQVLREMVDAGMEAAAIEVSSHGLAMGRVDTVDFDCAIFTNLTYDHLDYHKTMENYFEAKKLLFRNMKPEGIAVLNADDDVSIEGLKECCTCHYVTYGIDHEADYMAEDLQLTPLGTDFILVHQGERYPVHTNLIAKYNICNLLGAIAAMHQCGMDLETMLPLLGNIPQVDGRMEVIDEGQDFGVIVDYAHTPDGFEKVFAYADAVTKDGGDIYAVFGSAGKRDKVKRPVLGRIAGEHCKEVIVTEEDPRDETAEGISKDIIAGIEEAKGNHTFIADRIEAIEYACRIAKKGDLVLLLGKGDESYMYYNDGRHPYIGDHQAARQGLKARASEAAAAED